MKRRKKVKIKLVVCLLVFEPCFVLSTIYIQNSFYSFSDRKGITSFLLVQRNKQKTKFAVQSYRIVQLNLNFHCIVSAIQI